MDFSALIFVALAVAWAVYLIPKALKHHDEVVSSRSVDRFSQTMRVLARREPISHRDARLVVAPGRTPSTSRVEVKASSMSATAPPYAARRAAARTAIKRRRNVLATIVLLNTAVIALALGRLVVWPYVAIPAALLVAWLVACRVMVKTERATSRSRVSAPVPHRQPAAASGELPETVDSPVVDDVEAAEKSELFVEPVAEPVAEPVRAEGAWDMVPTTLPTYVSKSAAVRRTVHKIDLDSTGVWSSGRNDEDSALARAAEKSERVADAEAEHRAFGS